MAFMEVGGSSADDDISASIHQNFSTYEGDNVKNSYFAQSKHPTVLGFTLLFKCAAIVLYVVGGIILPSFIVRFVLLILLLVCDFWVVKNIRYISFMCTLSFLF